VFVGQGGGQPGRLPTSLGLSLARLFGRQSGRFPTSLSFNLACLLGGQTCGLQAGRSLAGGLFFSTSPHCDSFGLMTFYFETGGFVSSGFFGSLPGSQTFRLESGGGLLSC
jgi:hypothetical protein